MRRIAHTALLCVAVSCLAAPAQAESPEIAISPDDRHLYIGGPVTMTYQRELATGGLTLVDDRAPPGRALAMAPDGRHLYAADRFGVHVLSRDPDTGLLTHESTVTEGAAEFHALVVSPDGRHVYGANATTDELVIFERDASSGALRRVGAVYGGSAPGEVPWLDIPRALAVSPDGSSLYVAVIGVGAFARDADSGALTPLGFWYATSGSALDVAVSTDGRRVYAGRGSVTALERDPATGELTALNTLERPCGDFFCNWGWSIAPSPDDSIVMSTRQRERSLLQGRVVPEGLVHEEDYVEGEQGVQGLVNPLELAWSGDSRFLYVGVMRNAWFENGELYVTSPDVLSKLAVYRRDAGVARLQPAGLVDVRWTVGRFSAPTVTIEEGARYTRSPQVTLKITGGAYSVRISNNGSFGGPAVRTGAGTLEVPWTLEDTGLGRDVRRAYVRYTWPGYGDQLRDVSDDIVLDQRPPQLIAARARRASGGSARFVLRARDNRSGVRKVQITARRAKPGRRLPFRRKLVLRRRLPARAWTRVIDGAGNPSRWRHVRLTHQSTG